MVKRNDARFIRSKAEKLSVTNASFLCENNKTYWVGAASGGMFFVGSAVDVAVGLGLFYII